MMINNILYIKRIDKFMISNQKSPVKKNQNQDQIIQQIKTIALQIFNKPILNLRLMDFEATGIFLQNYPKSKQKVHAYTERKIVVDDEQCKSEWITYQNIQQFDAQFSDIMEDQKQIKKPIQKILHQRRINKGAKVEKINIKKQAQHKKKTQKIEEKKEAKEQVKQKIKLDKLDQYGFMQQKGKLKEQARQYIYQQKQKEIEEEIKKNIKNTKTLEVLYTQKQPLYDKFLKEKEKKMISIYQSRVADQKKQIQQIKEKPQINRNIKVQGNFNERLIQGARKAEQKKIKIINDMLKDNTFQPHVNNLKKFNKVESLVKKNWSEKSIDFQSLELFESKISYGQIGGSSKTTHRQNEGDRKGNKSVITGTSSKSTFNIENLKVSHSSELCNIFQIQDNTYE